MFQPLCLGGILSYFAYLDSPDLPEVSKQSAYINAIGIILLTLMTIIVVHPFSLNNIQIGTRMRVACTSMIYKKVR